MSQARRTITRLQEDQPFRDQRLDVGLSTPLANRASWLIIRTVALVIAAVAVVAIVPLEHAALIAVLLLASAVFQPIAAVAADTRDIGAAMAVADIVVAAGIAVLEPTLWTPAMTWMVSVTIWQTVTGTVRRSAVLLAFMVLVASAAGLVADAATWWPTTLTMAILGASYIGFGRAMRLEILEEEFETLETVSMSGAIVHRSDLDAGRTTHLRGDVLGLTGYTVEEWTTIDHRSLVHPDDLDTYWIDPDEVDETMLVDRVARFRRPDGSWFWARDISRIHVDRRGRRTLRGIMMDVTHGEEHRAELARQARLDLLTGLPNRLALHDELTALLGDGAPFALVFLDLDRFKEVNDTLGHEAGDEVLRVIADRLRSLVEPDQLLARLGGDEFAIVVPGARDDSRVAVLAERIANACSEPISVHSVDLALSQSSGIAFSDATSDRATMMRHADIAMYAAKRAGVGHRVFDASLEHTSTMQLSLSANLADALHEGQIELFFQPKFHVGTGRIVGAEGLIRWRHPDFGLLTPDAFLELALLSESATDLLRTSVEQAIEMIRRTTELGATVPVAANVAIASIRDIGFGELIHSLLRRHGVAPHLLTLELTENDVDRPSDQVVRIINRLSASGLNISIDDFGTGHSSLERLLSLHVDELKIDRMFVSRLLEDGRERRIVHTIIDLAARLGMRVVAEGIERAEQAEAIADMGCTIVQGYLYAPALPADEFLELVVRQKELFDGQVAALTGS